jgi:hypothetical protein
MKQETSSLYREMKQETVIQHPGITHEFNDCTCMKNYQNSTTGLLLWG